MFDFTEILVLYYIYNIYIVINIYNISFLHAEHVALLAS